MSAKTPDWKLKRILELVEEGEDRMNIAERFATNPRTIDAMVQRARRIVGGEKGGPRTS